MTDQPGLAVQEFVFDENNQERKPWTICGKPIPRSEIVFFSQFFIPQRRSYPRLTTLAFDINDIWCMDVAYVDKIAMPNGVKFLLLSVDVLSRYLRVEPLKRLISCCERWFSCHVK